MSNNTKLPRFLVADNPMTGNEIYIVVTRKVLCIIRASDMQVIVGEASEGLLQRCADWYQSYLTFLK